MTNEQIELARALVGLEGFRWEAGMRLRLWTEFFPQPVRIIGTSPYIAAHEGDWCANPCTGAHLRDVPDLTDPATGGVLLEALGLDGWDVICSFHDFPGWQVSSYREGLAFGGATLAEACARALVARGWYRGEG